MFFSIKFASIDSCMVIQQGQSSDGTMVAQTTGDLQTEILGGIMYLNSRFIKSDGDPPFNDLESYLLDTCRIEPSVAANIVDKFKEGFMNNRVDCCRLVVETTPYWQGGRAGEVKTLQW